jgi:hypothetical protein
LELGLNGIFLGLNGIDFLGFYEMLHFWIHCDTNGCTDFTDFTDWYRFFLGIHARNPSKKTKKIRTNP